MHRYDLLELLTEQPFRPFRMRLSLNVDVEVRHPETAILQHSAIRIEPPSQPGQISEGTIIVSLGQIVSIEYIPRKA